MGPFQGLNFIWVIKRSEKKLGSCLAVFLQKNFKRRTVPFFDKRGVGRIRFENSLVVRLMFDFLNSSSAWNNLTQRKRTHVFLWEAEETHRSKQLEKSLSSSPRDVLLRAVFWGGSRGGSPHGTEGMHGSFNVQRFRIGWNDQNFRYANVIANWKKTLFKVHYISVIRPRF